MQAVPRPLLTEVPLLAPQRRERIVDFLRRHGAVTLQQLAQAIDVSVSTLRRDLDSLEADGVLERTHGGAMLRHQHYRTFEPDATAAAELSPTEKRAIGNAAALTLEPGHSVIFDSGSTVLEAARAVVARRLPITAVTNDLAIAQLLGQSELIRVQVLGGRLRPGSHTLIGDDVIKAAAALHADVLLLGAHAVTHGVLSETDPDVVAIKRAWLASAARRCLLIDSSKFRPRTFMAVCEIDAFAQVYTDSGADAEVVAAIEQRGPRVTRVSP